jgi:flagellar motor protein MotB
MSVILPSRNTLGLLTSSQQDREPNWVKQLEIDTTQLTQVIGQVPVTVELFRVIPIHPQDARLTKPMKAYVEASGARYYSSIVAELNLRHAIETELGVPLDGLIQAANLPQPMSSDQYWSHFLLVTARFPDVVQQYLRRIEYTNLDRFEFNKSELRDFHIPLIDRIARDVVESWETPRKVTQITVTGHTDPRGGPSFNMGLGQQRAQSVADRLRRTIETIAPSYMHASLLNHLQFEVLSRGEYAASSPHHELSRRVEVELGYTESPPAPPLKLDAVVRRCLDLLQNQRTINGDTAQRSRCMLTKLLDLNIDDRYVHRDRIPQIVAENRTLHPTDWNRVRFVMVNPGMFGNDVSDEQVLRNLAEFEGILIAGGQAITQLFDQHGGAVPVAIQALRDWTDQRLDDAQSIYSCYREVFRP